MTCKHCGVEMLNACPNSSLEYYLHPGGTCPKQAYTVGNQEFTSDELAALKRVAQAQLEMEARRRRDR
jgi:hypothetical protein